VYLLNTFLDLTSCQKRITNIHNVMLLLYIHFSTHLFIYYYNKMYVMLLPLCFGGHGVFHTYKLTNNASCIPDVKVYKRECNVLTRLSYRAIFVSLTRIL